MCVKFQPPKKKKIEVEEVELREGRHFSKNARRLVSALKLLLCFVFFDTHKKANHAQLTTRKPHPPGDRSRIVAWSAAKEEGGAASSDEGELRRRPATTAAAAAATAADARVQSECSRPLRGAPAAASPSAAALRHGHGEVDI